MLLVPLFGEIKTYIFGSNIWNNYYGFERINEHADVHARAAADAVGPCPELGWARRPTLMWRAGASDLSIASLFLFACRTNASVRSATPSRQSSGTGSATTTTIDTANVRHLPPPRKPAPIGRDRNSNLFLNHNRHPTLITPIVTLTLNCNHIFNLNLNPKA